MKTTKNTIITFFAIIALMFNFTVSKGQTVDSTVLFNNTLYSMTNYTVDTTIKCGVISDKTPVCADRYTFYTFDYANHQSNYYYLNQNSNSPDSSGFILTAGSTLTFIDTISNLYDSIKIELPIGQNALHYNIQINNDPRSYLTQENYIFSAMLSNTNHSINTIQLLFKNTTPYNNYAITTGKLKITGYKTTNNVGINKYVSQVNELKAYPNPNNGNFTIHLDTKSENVDVNLYDIAGNLVYSNTERKTIGVNQIDMKLNVAPGMYFLKADNQTFKVIIE